MILPPKNVQYTKYQGPAIALPLATTIPRLLTLKDDFVSLNTL